MSLSSTTNNAIALALAELENNPERQLSPQKRLAIYDSFGEQINLTELTKTETTKFSALTPGYQRYLYLNLLTVMHVMPIWDEDMPRFRAENPSNLASIAQFPHHILQTAQSALQQNHSVSTLHKLKEDFRAAINSLPIVLKYNVIEVATAAYSFFLTVNHYTPFSAEAEDSAADLTLETASDVDFYKNSRNWDVAWHASQASCAIDNDPIGSQHRHPIEYDIVKRYQFWQWWLTEAVPQAATLAL